MYTRSQARALLVKLGAIGDCLMLLPGAHALHHQGSPETSSMTSIDWICGSITEPLLALYPWIRPIAIDERSFIGGSLPDRLRSLVQLWPQLARKPYDLVATVYYDPRYRLLTLPTRARRRLHLSHTDRTFRLLPGRHHTDEFARILLGWPDDVRSTSLAPVPPPVFPPSPYPRSASQLRSILVPGGARNFLRDDALRRWPLANYVALARSLLDRGHEVILAGGPEDLWVSPAFAGLPVTGLVGGLSLVETLGLFVDADLVVTHDTGPLHLAGLTPTPLLSFFGPTDPHSRLPQRPGVLALWGGERFACRPCYDSQTYAACRHNACIEQITPRLALHAVDSLLANPRIPPTVVAPDFVPWLPSRHESGLGTTRPSIEASLRHES